MKKRVETLEKKISDLSTAGYDQLHEIADLKQKLMLYRIGMERLKEEVEKAERLNEIKKGL